MPLILLNGQQLADRLNVRYQTVLSWARQERIPSIKDGRGRRVFNLDAVLTALQPEVRKARRDHVPAA